MKTNLPKPKRSEVWTVNFDPTIGSEMKKVRPAIVLSSDGLAKLPLRIIAPITGWQEDFQDNIWHIQIIPSSSNGLSKTSAVDVLQLRSADVQRFIVKIGVIPMNTMEEIAAAVASVVEYI